MRIDLSLDKVEMLGSGLVRPEGVMAMADGTVWCAHGKGHCSRIAPDGSVEEVGELGGEPNGICIDRDGNVIVANIGNGKVQRLYPGGRSETLTDSMEGRPFPAPNFPFWDLQDRLWVSNSTELQRHSDATRVPVPDGCLCLIEGGETRIVAEGIRFANGVALDREERYVYVAETMGCCVLRYEMNGDGSLGRGEQYGPELGKMGYPDGIAFDGEGNLWVTLVIMNALAVITPDRELHIVLHDPEGKKLNRPTNICFGGEDLRTAFIGSLRGESIPYFRVPFAGMPLVHQI